MKKAGLRKSQIDWIKEEVEAGGLVWILIEHKEFIYVVNGLYVEILNDVNEETVSSYSAAVWTKGISHSEKAAIVESILLNKA